MTDNNAAIIADSLYNDLREVLDGMDVNYEHDDEERKIVFGVSSDVLLMKYHITVNEENNTLTMIAILPIHFNEEKRAMGAMVTSVANSGMLHGCFDYDYRSGMVLFKISIYYENSLISKNLIGYMLALSADNTEKYGKLFAQLNMGTMTLEDFMSIK